MPPVYQCLQCQHIHGSYSKSQAHQKRFSQDTLIASFMGIGGGNQVRQLSEKEILSHAEHGTRWVKE